MHSTIPVLKRGPHGPQRKSVLFQFCILILFFLSFSSTTLAQQVAKTSTNGTKMWVYTPPGYSTSTATYPLLIFLHGGSEIADDLTKLTTGTSHQYPPKLISTNQWDKTLPFIVVSPQLKRDLAIKNPNDQEWPAAYVDAVIEWVRKNYRVDAYRIYLTGVSLGAHGVWTYTSTYPTKVAGIVPISGKSDATKGCAFKSIPVWAFHGENDGLVRPQFSVDMYNAIRNCGGVFKPRLNLLYSRMHEGWNEIYNRTNGYDIYNWFLKFRRANTTNKTPYVNAGKDNKILLRTTTHHLAGDFFDWDGTISAIAWTKISGPVVTLAGANTAFLRLSSLKVGVYEFQLKVTDNRGAVSFDRVKLEIVSPVAPPAVTALTLMNGKTNADIGIMKEGQVINKTTLGTTEFNVRATVSTGVGSVRFSVNSDQHTKTVNASGPYLIKKQTTAPEWTMTNGTHVICATPYPQTGGRGVPGISLCYKVTVTQSTTSTMVTAQSISPENVENETVTIRAIDDILISNIPDQNQWVLNGEDIEGATGPVYKPTLPGEYYVRITDRPRNDVSNLVPFEIQTLEKPSGVRVYPNPAGEFLNVQSDMVKENTSYRIIRIGGALVQEGFIGSDQRIALPSSLQGGEYILILKTEKGNESIKFLVR